jgi:hypothetical protein
MVWCLLAKTRPRKQTRFNATVTAGGSTTANKHKIRIATLVWCLLAKIGTMVWWLFAKIGTMAWCSFAVHKVSISITAGIASANTDIKTTVTAGGSTTTTKHKIRIATTVCVYWRNGTTLWWVLFAKIDIGMVFICNTQDFYQHNSRHCISKHRT